MAIPKPRFIVDDHGEKTAVILDMAEYKKLLEEAEELEAIRAYDAAKAASDEVIPFEQAVAEIERDRK
jgi:PHD/YefM family antitoxin component YafN of YafNO toxin-antitoxin module